MSTQVKSRAQEGASAVEYSFLVSAITAILVLVVFAIGGLTGAMFSDTCSSLAAGDYSASVNT
ncbi:MAG: Flp family type IVb pilin, partial [Aeromicrobium sp.]